MKLSLISLPMASLASPAMATRNARPRLFAAHCRYMEPGDFALLGKARCMVSHQAPMAADRGADTPVPELRAAGVTMVYGSDNNTNDIFEVMRIAMVTERIYRANQKVDPEQPLPGSRLLQGRFVS